MVLRRLGKAYPRRMGAAVSRRGASAAQCAMTIGDVYLASTTIDDAAQRHARRHGLSLVCVERGRDLFGAPVEVAVFQRADGGLVRRTAEMLASAGTV